MAESQSDTDLIVLMLNGYRISVHKSKLASKSRYFSSLFSHDFNDSQNSEQAINYDISRSTLEDFVNWVEDDGESTEDERYPMVKPSLRKFEEQLYKDLSDLLEVSVLFMADDLTEEIIDIIVHYWLLPDKVTELWLLARELNLTVLRDICFSVCLDKFGDMPMPLAMELSKDDYNKIMRNVNVRSSKHLLEFTNKDWIQHNVESNDINLEIERKPKFIQGMLASKSSPFVPKEPCVYVWDKICLKELVKVKNLPNQGKDLIGMQVTGRGFSIYMIGGEMGIGTGQFNKYIWRYCLFAKKWYYLQRLPVPRRHMITVFIGSKLYIVGGVGRHRLKLSTMDIFNVHNCAWSKGARVPEEFTEIPPHCVMNGKLFFIKSSIYIYHPDTNHWETLPIFSNPAVSRVDALMVYNKTLFMSGHHLGEEILLRVDTTNESSCKKEECIREHCEHSVITNVNIVHEDESCQLRYAQVAGVGIMLLGTRDDSDYKYLHVQTGIRRDLSEYNFNPRLGYFSVIDPSTLYDTIESA